MKATINEIQKLRDALFYVGHNTRTIGEYRLRGCGEWRPLGNSPDRKLINLNKYEYRTSEPRFWLSRGYICCSGGGLRIDIACRIITKLTRQNKVQIVGHSVVKYPSGIVKVGCQTFTKDEVAYARKLLAAA
jgi:hypothetical protein